MGMYDTFRPCDKLKNVVTKELGITDFEWQTKTLENLLINIGIDEDLNMVIQNPGCYGSIPHSAEMEAIKNGKYADVVAPFIDGVCDLHLCFIDSQLRGIFLYQNGSTFVDSWLIPPEGKLELPDKLIIFETLEKYKVIEYNDTSDMDPALMYLRRQIYRQPELTFGDYHVDTTLFWPHTSVGNFTYTKVKPTPMSEIHTSMCTIKSHNVIKLKTLTEDVDDVMVNGVSEKHHNLMLMGFAIMVVDEDNKYIGHIHETRECKNGFGVFHWAPKLLTAKDFNRNRDVVIQERKEHMHFEFATEDTQVQPKESIVKKLTGTLGEFGVEVPVTLGDRVVGQVINLTKDADGSYVGNVKLDPDVLKTDQCFSIRSLPNNPELRSLDIRDTYPPQDEIAAFWNMTEQEREDFITKLKDCLAERYIDQMSKQPLGFPDTLGAFVVLDEHGNPLPKEIVDNLLPSTKDNETD